MDDIKIIKDRALNMYKADEDNIKMFQAMWDMWNMDWTMPPNLSKHSYIRKMVSPDPHDAIRVGTQVLASVMPMPSINSLAPDSDSRAHFDDLERAISWLFRTACIRRGNPLADIVRHALLFDRVAAQVVYLPNQIGILKAFQGENHRKSHALRYGPFAIIVRDPRNVHVEWSDYMPERVLYRTLMPVHEMVDFWGDNARKLIKKQDYKKWDGYEWVTVFDYHDMEQRVVWAVMQDNNSRMASPTDGEDNKDAIVIMQEENKLDFLPWVVRDGGEQLDPILLPVWKTNLWEDMNLYETLMSSEIIAHTSAPRIKKTSYNPDGINVDYGGTPGGSVNVQPGEDVEPLLPPQMDANLAQLLDRLQGRMAKSTVPNVIQSVDFPAEWAYATLNLAVQSGVKVLTPARELAQRALSDVFRQMFYWADYSGDTIIAYPTRQEIVPEAVGEGMSEFARVIPNQTEQIEIRPGDFDPEHMYIDVALEMDIPSDRVGRAQTAVTLKERLQYSNRQALDDVGVSDPSAMMEEWRKEQEEQNDFDIELQDKRERALTDVLVERQQKLMEAQQATAPEQPPPPPNTIENPALGGQQEAGRNPANQAQARANAGTQLPLGGM